MRNALITFALACCAISTVSAQPCAEVQTLEGKLIFHDSIRQWFELKLDAPRCGQSSIQLVQEERQEPALAVLRGCRVRSRGGIAKPLTGYYSLSLYQDVTEVVAIGACVHQPPFPDYSEATPDPAIRKYRVEMQLNYESGDHPVHFTVSSAGKELKPWQAYTHHFITGGKVLYGFCAKGFLVQDVSGTPQANPSEAASDIAMFNPERAAAAGIKDLRLGYTCVRLSSPSPRP